MFYCCQKQKGAVINDKVDAIIKTSDGTLRVVGPCRPAMGKSGYSTMAAPAVLHIGMPSKSFGFFFLFRRHLKP